MLEPMQWYLGWFYRMRSLYLFLSLLLFISASQFIDEAVVGQRLLLNFVNVFVLVAAVAAVGRTRFSFALALLFTVPVIGFQVAGLLQENGHYLHLSWAFGAMFYLVTLIYLLRYVFSSDVMTADKLFGAGAAYMLLGVLWAYFYALAQHFDAGGFAVYGDAAAVIALKDVIYFSITTLTSTGYGDITPAGSATKALANVEQILGTLFVAILIARLAGIYPDRE